jgi:hypothetical protein
MTVVLNHTIVPVGDKLRGAQVLADLLGLEVGAPAGPFVPVRINEDVTRESATLTESRTSSLPQSRSRK